MSRCFRIATQPNVTIDDAADDPRIQIGGACELFIESLNNLTRSITRKLMPDTATGEDLDRLAPMFGLER